MNHLYILILSIGVSCVTFKSDYREEYTTTITRAVGPTTLTGARGTLPQPAPTDGNSAWLAMNGNDANAGTQAAPKLTLAGAIAILGGGITTVHIFRNGFVGELLFTGAGQTLPASTNIQVEEGEIAEIRFTSTTYRLETAGTANTINGIIISNTNASLAVSPLASGGSCTLDNVEIRNALYDRLGSVETSSGATDNFNYSIMAFITGFGTNTFNITNSIIIAEESACLFISMIAASTTTINITRSLIIAFGRNAFDEGVGDTPSDPVFGTPLHVDINTTAALTINLTADSSVFDALALTRVYDNASELTTLTYNVVFDYCLNKTANVALLAANVTGTFTQAETITNAIAPITPELYINRPTGINDGVAELLRLQAKGKTTPDGSSKYVLDSPLIGAGLAGVDVNPWDESTVLVGNSFNMTSAILWPPKSLRTEFRLINRTFQSDPNGNPRSAYDAMRKVFSFVFNTYTNNENIWRMCMLMMDRGTLAFYPRGEGESLFTDAVSGAFDNTDNSFTPVTTLGFLIPEHWNGFWITFNDSDYYIVRNDASKLYLADKLGNGFPANASYDFSIEYILVQPDMESIEAVQEYFTNYLMGGAWREKDSLGVDTTLALEYNGLSASFVETEDLEENT